MAEVLRAVRVRTQDQIATLQWRLQRIDDYQAQHEAELAGRTDFRARPSLWATWA